MSERLSPRGEEDVTTTGGLYQLAADLHRLTRIQSSVDEAGSGMQMGTERVTLGVDKAVKAGQSITELGDQTGSVVSAIADISNAISEQSAASVDLGRSVEHIVQASEENTSAIVALADTTGRLDQLAADLHRLTRRFSLQVA